MSQQATGPSVADASQLEQVPKVPGVGTLLHGLNAGVTFSGVHDSSIGWYNVVTPAVSYAFSQHFSADASVSIYPYRLVEQQLPTTPPSFRLAPAEGETGDTLIGLHAAFNRGLLRSTSTAYLSAPSGDQSVGLGTGKAAFDFSEHLERYAGRFALIADLGVGNSSVLFNNLVTRDYSSVGALAHFQEGIALWLPGRSYIQAVAYEQVPFGNQTVYAALGRPGSPPVPVASTSSESKDDGVTTSVGIPLTPHIEVSSYYNRSLRQHDDTVSVGMTFVLRGTLKSKSASMIDRALREAESGQSPR